MGVLVVIAALLLPIAPLLLRTRAAHRLTDRLVQDVGENAVGLGYIAGCLAAFFLILWAASLTDAGPGVLVAFAVSTLAVVTFRLLNGENVDFD